MLRLAIFILIPIIAHCLPYDICYINMSAIFHVEIGYELHLLYWISWKLPEKYKIFMLAFLTNVLFKEENAKMFFTAFGDHVKHLLTQWHHFLLIKRWTPRYQRMKRLIIQTDHIGSLKHQNWFEYCHCFNLHIAIVVSFTHCHCWSKDGLLYNRGWKDWLFKQIT